MFRFTIRDMLWLTVVVAMGLAWWSQQATIKWERISVERDRAALAAKRAELDQRFLRLVDATDQLNIELERVGSSSSTDNRP
jgi:hypothetical protein